MESKEKIGVGIVEEGKEDLKEEEEGSIGI
jgi:hypothetical protein